MVISKDAIISFKKEKENILNMYRNSPACVKF